MSPHEPGSATLKDRAADQNMLHVVKTHVVPPGGFPKNAWLFASEVNDAVSFDDPWQGAAKRMSQKLDHDVKYVQVLSRMTGRGSGIVTEYQSFFGLIDQQLEELVTYLRYWDVLRMCCGAQMNEAYRAELISGTPPNPSEASKSEYPACDMYTIQTVEHQAVRTRLFRLASKGGSGTAYLRSTSSLEADSGHELNGRYCEWFNRQTACQHLPFNKLPSLPDCDDAGRTSMHLLSSCDQCGVDWCQKASQGACVPFSLADGAHVLGPAVGKIGCDALTNKTPYCIAGSDDLYAAGAPAGAALLTAHHRQATAPSPSPSPFPLPSPSPKPQGSRVTAILQTPAYKPPLADVVRHVCDNRVRRACSSERDKELCEASNSLLQAMPPTMFSCPEDDIVQTSVVHYSGSTTCSLLDDIVSFSTRAPLEATCEKWKLSGCSIFGYVLIFDGLGHYFNKLRTLLLREHRQGVFHGYESFFEEFVGRSAVHLKLPNLPGNASLYCHQKQLASEESFSNDEDFWEQQYVCNLVPPLDHWFNLQSELYHSKRGDEQCVQWQVNNSTANSSVESNLADPAEPPQTGKVAGSPTEAEASVGLTADWRNFLRERYWAGRRPMITCGREVSQRSNWELAIHLRLGDLIAPVIGPGDTQREHHYSERAAQGASGLKRVLSLLSHIQTTLRNSSAAFSFRSLVVSDSPFAVVKDFLRAEAGIHLSVQRRYNDDVATFIDVIAQFSDVAPSPRFADERSFKLSFMNEDANPLVAMHCLAAADALVLPSEQGDKPSSFALMAAALSRGSVIPSIEHLQRRISRISRHNGAAALGASFVEHMMLPRGTFVADEEDGAYVLQQLPKPGDPV
jgi:hypothetical protein